MQNHHLSRSKLRRFCVSVAFVTCAMAAVPALAGVVVVPYTGSYDERTQAPGGDYDGIGGLADVGEFTLLAGSNFFLGAVRTPNDSSDAFLIRIAPNFKLVGASIQWATNATALNPVFAAPAPIWTLEESDADPTIFLLNMAGNGTTAPVLHTAPAFERGPGQYSVLLGNGTFAMNNNDAIAYRMNFLVMATPVAEPSPALLLGVGLTALVTLRRRLTAKSASA
jgi:hypothetical protein